MSAFVVRRGGERFQTRTAHEPVKELAMHWLMALGVGAVTAMVSAMAAGLTASRAAVWYRVANADGAAYVLVIYAALGGALAGGLAGTALAAAMGPEGWRAMAVSTATMLAGIGVIAGVAWMRADHSPLLEGEPLVLRFELRAPRGWRRGASTGAHISDCTLTALGVGNRRGEVAFGPVDWPAAAERDGQWVIPASVALFSSRERRLVNVRLAPGESVEVFLPMPGQPGAAEANWSPWRTGGMLSGPTGFAYRFRVETESEARRADLRRRERPAEDGLETEAIEDEARRASW